MKDWTQDQWGNARDYAQKQAAIQTDIYIKACIELFGEYAARMAQNDRPKPYAKKKVTHASHG